MIYSTGWLILDYRGGYTIMYSAGDKAMATVHPSYQPLTKARREVIQNRVESRFKESIIDYAFDPIMVPGKYGQVQVVSMEDKALEMMTEEEFVMTFDRLAKQFAQGVVELELAMGVFNETQTA